MLCRMKLDGSLRKIEPPTNVLVRKPFHQGKNDFPLAACQRVHGFPLLVVLVGKFFLFTKKEPTAQKHDYEL